MQNNKPQKETKMYNSIFLKKGMYYSTNSANDEIILLKKGSFLFLYHTQYKFHVYYVK